MEERFEMFTVLMAKIRRNIQRIKTEEMAEYNLKSPHVSCLYYLYTHGSLTATELCDICFEDKAAISRSILQLEKLGYVEYSEKAKKRYRADITLTEKGREIAKCVSKKVNFYIDKIGGELSEKERLIFYKSLSTISKNLDAIDYCYENVKEDL